MAHRGARHDEAEGVDRIARVRHEDDVARRGDRLREIGQPLLRAEGDDDLALRIELDAEAARVIAGAGAAQPGDAARHRISVGLRVLHRLDELGDDVRRGRAVRIAHAEIDHVSPGGARLRLQRIDFAEDVGRKALDAIELFGHGSSAADGRPLVIPEPLFCECYPMDFPEQERVFFEAVGRAFGVWQHVEMQLFRVYARLIRPENAEVASAAFYSVVNFNTRLGMTNAAAHVALAGNAALSVWNALHNRAGRQAKRRNELAHFAVVYGVNPPTSSEFGPFLQPSIFDVTERETARQKRIDASRIKDAGNSFTRLAEDLTAFADGLPELGSSLGRLI